MATRLRPNITNLAQHTQQRGKRPVATNGGAAPGSPGMMGSVIFVAAFGLLAGAGMRVCRYSVLGKFMRSNAHQLGLPVSATICVNQVANPTVTLFRADPYWNGQPARQYLIHFSGEDTSGTRAIYRIDAGQQSIGLPGSTNQRDYDVVADRLFQSGVGSKFTPITDNIKGGALRRICARQPSKLRLVCHP